MGGGYSLPSDKHIVIVGGGFAGTKLAEKLMENQANFTLIDPKDMFHQNTAAVRACTEPGFAAKTFIPYEPMFHTHFKRGKVISVNTTDKAVLLDSGDTVSYDVLVIATGSCGPFPFKIPYQDREEAIRNNELLMEQIQSSERIVCVGGGACGVEVAAEIATDYPEKKVTIIHSGQVLASKDPTDKFQQRLQALLGEIGVKVIMGERVTNVDDIEANKNGNWKLKTSSGTEVEADLVLKCTGLWVNSDAYKDGLGDKMAANGALNVNEFLQVEGYDNIFAIGDCNNVDEPKMAILAAGHGEHLLLQLSNMFAGRPLVPLTPDNKPVRMVLSVGRDRGLGQLKNGYMLPEFIVRRLKCNDLFVSRYWKELKQQMP